jgi:ribosomal protein L7/L12
MCQEAITMRSQLHAAEQQQAALEAQHSAARLDLQQAHMLLSLSEKECDGLKRLVTLLEAELTQQVTQPAAAAAAAAAAAGGSDGEPMAVDDQQLQGDTAAAAAGGGSSSSVAAMAAAKVAAVQELVEQLKGSYEQLQAQLKAAVAAEHAAKAAAAAAKNEAQELGRETEELAVRCQALEVRTTLNKIEGIDVRTQYDNICSQCAAAMTYHSPALPQASQDMP